MIVFAGGGRCRCSAEPKLCGLSTPKSEDAALADVSRDLVLIRELLGFLGPICQQWRLVSVFVYLAVKFEGKHVCTSRTTRIVDVRCPFVRAKVEKNIVLVVHVPSTNQSTDDRTKNFPSETRV